MTKGLLAPIQISFFLPKILVWKTKNSSSDHIFIMHITSFEAHLRNILILHTDLMVATLKIYFGKDLGFMYMIKKITNFR
jgi:hypothetical protein